VVVCVIYGLNDTVSVNRRNYTLHVFRKFFTNFSKKIAIGIRIFKERIHFAAFLCIL
jgi:hypothetical protein